VSIDLLKALAGLAFAIFGAAALFRLITRHTARSGNRRHD